MNTEKWFVKMTTDVGSLILPFMSSRGYSTKREADFAASEIMQNVTGIVSAEVFKEGE